MLAKCNGRARSLDVNLAVRDINDSSQGFAALAMRTLLSL